MKKILIITSSFDYTVDYIINKYSSKYNFYRVNIDRFSNYEFNVSFNAGFEIKSSQWSINEDEIHSIYYRKPVLPDLSNYESCYHNMISRDIIAFINGVVDAFDGNVLSKPSLLKCAENKVYQVKVANKVGFKFPISSIGNSNNSINKVITNKAIIKPLTTGKVVFGDKCEIIQTSSINEYITEDISLTPLYVQRYVDKKYEVRVTIINKEVFATKIIAFNKIDWRIDQYNNTYEVIDIPNNIKEKCLAMMDIMNLKFGAFDFIVDKNNEYVFLEINPNGQWLWVEEILGFKISNKIMSYLGEGTDKN